MPDKEYLEQLKERAKDDADIAALLSDYEVMLHDLTTTEGLIATDNLNVVPDLPTDLFWRLQHSYFKDSAHDHS